MAISNFDDVSGVNPFNPGQDPKKTLSDPAFAPFVEQISGDAPQSAPVTQNTSLPTVDLSVSATAGTEAGATVITVTATASVAVSGDQTVSLAVTGPGITAGDFTLSSPQITIANGTTQGSITFTVQNDTVAEPVETARLTISNPSSGITLGTMTTQDITITSDDAETPSLVVNTTADTINSNDGVTSLREAIAFANRQTDADTDGNALDTVTFDPTVFANGGLIRLSLGSLNVTSAVRIDGSSAGGEVVITGDVNGDDQTVTGTNRTNVQATQTAGNLTDNVQVLNFNANSDGSSLHQLTITGGANTPFGGGIEARDTALTITNSTVAGNTATAGGGVYAGRSQLSISNSTISDNIASSGGGLYLYGSSFEVANSTIASNQSSTGGGGLFSNTGASSAIVGQIVNSTFYGNQAGTDGGGIFNRLGSLTIQNSTISDNNGSTGGGVASFGNANITTNVQSSIIARNSATSGNDVSSESPLNALNSFRSLGNNLIGDGQFAATGGTVDFFINGQNDDIVGTSLNPVNPLLGPLTNNGGPTQTMAPQANSPVINAGSNPQSLTTDQRGTGFTRTLEGTADIGAIEREASSLVVTTASDTVNAFDGLTSLREAIALANATAGADTITFAAGTGQAFANGGLIRLTQGELAITDAVTINGAGNVTITGDALDNDITVQGDITDVTATLASGTTLLNDNSRIFNITSVTATTTLDGLTLTGGRTTSANDNDGGAILSAADLTVTSSSISGNSTSELGGRGGGIYGGGAVSLINSTISGNSTQGLVGSGGGVSGANARITLTNSTVSGNSTQGLLSNGGGIFSFDAVTLTIARSAATAH